VVRQPLGKVDFEGLKLKVPASNVTIASTRRGT
jgi:hypothetical protein